MRNFTLGQEKPKNLSYGQVSLREKSLIVSELLRLPGEKKALVRLYNPGAVASRSTLKFRGAPIRKMYSTDLLGENGEEIPAQLAFTVPARSIVTLVVEGK